MLVKTYVTDLSENQKTGYFVVYRPPKHLVSEAHFRRQLFLAFFIEAIDTLSLHACTNYIHTDYIHELHIPALITYATILPFSICSIKFILPVFLNLEYLLIQVTAYMTINYCILWKYSLLDHVILKPQRSIQKLKRKNDKRGHQMQNYFP